MRKILQKVISEEGSNGAGKSQFTCLQPHLYAKMCVPHTYISTRK